MRTYIVHRWNPISEEYGTTLEVKAANKAVAEGAGWQWLEQTRLDRTGWVISHVSQR